MSAADRWDTLVGSMRSLVSTGIAIVHTRVELIGIELEQELWRARSLFIWATAALLLTLLAIGFAGIALIVTFWDTHRQLVSALVAGTFVVLALVAVATLMSTLRARPRPFQSTLGALEGDLDALRRDS
jgi:uncharacterized membrane protein YqjE